LCAIAKLDAERRRADGLTLQLEASQGALADVIAEHTQSEQDHERVAAQNLADYLALTQRADAAERERDEAFRDGFTQRDAIADKVRRYVAFVLSGDENADVQVAADRAWVRIERAEAEAGALREALAFAVSGWRSGERADCGCDGCRQMVAALATDAGARAQAVIEAARDGIESFHDAARALERAGHELELLGYGVTSAEMLDASVAAFAGCHALRTALDHREQPEVGENDAASGGLEPVARAKATRVPTRDRNPADGGRSTQAATPTPGEPEVQT
jgi:hypothetical protein